MFGIAARNGILLINHCQHLERHEGEAFGPALVVRGAQERLSPILMTALATGLALVPLLVAGTIPGHEIEHPMALVIVGGLVTSTLVNLFIVPRCTCASRSRDSAARPRERRASAGAALLVEDAAGERRRDLVEAVADGRMRADGGHDLLDRCPDLVVGQAEGPGSVDARAQRRADGGACVHVIHRSWSIPGAAAGNTFLAGWHARLRPR